MNGLVLFASPDPLVGQLASAAVKGSVLLLCVLLLDLTLRRQSAALRHRVWTAALVSLLLLPLVAPLAPSWNVPLLPGPETGPVTHEPAARELLAEAERSPADGTPRQELAAAPDSTRELFEHEPASAAALGAGGGSVGADLPWSRLALATWGLGALLLAGRLTLATLRAGHLCRTARSVDDPDWRRALDRARRRLGLEAPVRLVQSDAVTMPMAWGLRRHAVVLPKGADSWSDDRREVVLLHELAHVLRGDCLAHLLGGLAASLYWFHPLIWIARRRQVAERELACDDTVLAAGARGADYAWHLLEIARGSNDGPRLAPAGVMMARKSQLEGRLLAVLDGSRDRSNVSRVGSLALTGACLTAVLALAGLQPWAVTTAEATEPATLESEMPLTVELEVQDLAPAPALRPTDDGAAEPAASEEAPGGRQESSRARVMEMMLGLLDDPDLSIRKQAIHSLGEMEDPAAVQALGRVVTSDDDPGMRSQAAWALGMIESPEAVSALAQAMDDSDAKVRSQVAWALGMIESADGVSALEPGLSDSEPKVRSQVAWALGMIESPAAVPALTRALQQETDSSVQSQMAWALGMIEDESALEALIDLVETGDDRVRKQALWAIGMIMG